jgi:phosphoglycolate phosphatase-like HAD superfamily hydrolase
VHGDTFELEIHRRQPALNLRAQDSLRCCESSFSFRARGPAVESSTQGQRGDAFADSASRAGEIQRIDAAMLSRRVAAPLLFDAVIFDLDGTLVATERFWVAAASAGARRAFDELGLARDVPAAEQWLGMVGLPLERAFELVFADLDDERRRHVMARCVEAEEAALRAGGAALMPGAWETLTRLRERGAKLGVASNCARSYLDTMLRELKLGELVHEARCLDSPGVRTKTDMLRDLLATFGTRAAVMVGDRATDAQAAHANALPHVHLASGFAPAGERVDAEATIAGLGELPELLDRRAQSIELALQRLGALRRGARGLTLAVTGPMAAGKSSFARDAARVMSSHSLEVAVIALDAFPRPEPGESGDDHLARAFDVDRLLGAVLEPRARGEPTQPGPWGPPVPRESALIVEGLFLLHPRVRLYFDRVVQLDVDDATAVARAAARDGDPELLARLRRDFLPAQRAFEAAFDPSARADLRLDARNPLQPGP